MREGAKVDNAGGELCAPRLYFWRRHWL